MNKKKTKNIPTFLKIVYRNSSTFLKYNKVRNKKYLYNSLIIQQ